jgi:signal transduction histidine kinase
MSVPFAPRGLVWVVDDSALQRAAIRATLAPAFDVETFDDGAPALERLASSGDAAPDVMVVDWHMPVISGLVVCEVVRQRFDVTTLPILILTATGDGADLLAGLAAGANDYVGKPFNDLELIARVTGLVRAKRLGDALRSEAQFRERFIGVLGHELRQPLSTFLLGARTLLHGGLSPAHTQTARRLASAADRMSRMVADLLDVTRSRLGSGIPINRRSVDLREICGQVVEDYQALNPDRRIEVSISGDTKGDWDPDRLTQVCTNLLGNAFEHGCEGSPIFITIAAADGEVFLCVENAGEEISGTLRESLFEPFRRGRNAATAGLGLGLFIVDQIVRAHDGTTTVTSDENATHFMVRLPRAARVA